MRSIKFVSFCVVLLATSCVCIRAGEASPTGELLRSHALRFKQSSYTWERSIRQVGTTSTVRGFPIAVGDTAGTISLSNNRFHVDKLDSGGRRGSYVFDGNRTLIWLEGARQRDRYTGDAFRAQEVIGNPFRLVVYGTENATTGAQLIWDVVDGLLPTVTPVTTTSVVLGEPTQVLHYQGVDHFCQIDAATKRLLVFGDMQMGGIPSVRYELGYDSGAAEANVTRLRRTTFDANGDGKFVYDSKMTSVVLGKDSVAAVTSFATEPPAGISVREMGDGPRPRVVSTARK